VPRRLGVAALGLRALPAGLLRRLERS